MHPIARTIKADPRNADGIIWAGLDHEFATDGLRLGGFREHFRIEGVVRIRRDGGDVQFTDGPFLESKEYLAGFWIVEAPDLDVALELAADGSKSCNRKVEVRPFH